VEAASSAAVAGGRPEAPSLRAARRRWGETLIKGFLLLAALISLLTTFGIVYALLEETIVFFGQVGLHDFLFGTKWTPLFSDPSFGVLPLVVGTFATTLIGLAVAIPLGLGAAIFLSEYARPRVRKVVKPIIELLAGIPTIVFGYFALTFFTPEILRGAFHLDVGIFNALAAGIIIGFLIIPIVASISEDAMRSVPQALREGAFGLGASKLQVTLRVVFPAALSGIVASIVLAMSRAVGETMVVLIAGGQQPQWGADIGKSMETLTAFIGATAKGDVPTGSVEYKTLFAVGMTLFVITLVINIISIRLVRKYRQVYE
jgi:phosphate transport system permease protein